MDEILPVCIPHPVRLATGPWFSPLDRGVMFLAFAGRHVIGVRPVRLVADRRHVKRLWRRAGCSAPSVFHPRSVLLRALRRRLATAPDPDQSCTMTRHLSSSPEAGKRRANGVLQQD
jgi:hypothetical protein